MRRNLIVLLTILACGLTGCKSGQKDGNMENETKLKIETTAGDIVVKLYNETPRHRDNFIKLAKDGDSGRRPRLEEGLQGSDAGCR